MPGPACRNRSRPASWRWSGRHAREARPASTPSTSTEPALLGFWSRAAPTADILVGMPDVTQLLDAAAAGDPKAAAELLPLVYDELRKLATTRMAEEKPGQTLQ